MEVVIKFKDGREVEVISYRKIGNSLKAYVTEDGETYYYSEFDGWFDSTVDRLIRRKTRK